MKFKRYISAILSAAVTASSVGVIQSSADELANPVISRNCPAYSQLNSDTASAANDDFYYSFWSGSAGDYLAYDLSGIPRAERGKVLAAWYNAAGNYDSTVTGQTADGIPTDYTIEVNDGAGGTCPVSGWKTVETVKDNTLHSRQHVIDMTGYNWIRLNVQKAGGSESGSVSVNFDIHNVSEGVSDSWIFFGDSITAGGMMNCYGTSFAQYVNSIDSRYFPAQENGGIGGIFSTDGKNNIVRWLSTFPGRYVSIAYGTNDAWGNQTGAENYYNNTAYMVEQVLKAGKTPIVPKIPYSTNTDLSSNLAEYNAQIDRIYKNYPKVIKGPDFYAYFEENPHLLSADGVHPTSEGYDGMRQLWARTMYTNVYKLISITSDEEYIIGDINEDGDINTADAVLLCKYLLNCTNLEEYSNSDKTADLDGNGKVNVMDWVRLKRMLSIESDLPGEIGSDGLWKAVDSNVKLQGRNIIDSETTWLVQSGSAAEFTVTGSSAKLVLAGDDGIGNDKDFRPRYAVYVDNELICDNTMDSREKTVELFSGSDKTEKTVKVILLSEAMYGGLGIKGIDVTSDDKKPVRPVQKGKLNIEFIGDSITCAYGVEGAGNGDSFKTTTENFTKSYAYLTAQKLGADYSACCYSGNGIISGYSSDGNKNTDNCLIPDCYDVASKWGNYDKSWDFAGNKRDVVVINLGTNDSSYISANGITEDEKEERAREFVDGYKKFLETVREKNSSAYIICTVGTMLFDNTYEYVEKAVEEYKTETGDSRILYYRSATQSADDGYGSDWHPSEVTQQKISYVLADKICTALGLESDQEGLDVAAEAEYILEMDESKGANAASFVGYDKSFWVNTVTGGSSPEDIRAVLKGISLKKGSKYLLEFDYTSSKEYEMPVRVTRQGSSSSDDIFFEEQLKTNSEKQHFSAEFTCDRSDVSSIEFLLGGQDSCNTTLSAIKLTVVK